MYEYTCKPKENNSPFFAPTTKVIHLANFDILDQMMKMHTLKSASDKFQVFYREECMTSPFIVNCNLLIAKLCPLK